MDFLAITRGDEAVSEQDGLAAFEILTPILLAGPRDAEAVAAAYRTISRMPRECLAAALLDWWFVTTTTGTTSPLGLGFHLPDSVPTQLRNAMESVTALAHSGLPTQPGDWVQRAHELADLLAHLDDALQLDSYGRSKLPGERDVWSYLQDELAPTVEALRNSRQTPPFDLDAREYEKQMKNAGIDENSRRWNEMTKRAHKCVGWINQVVHVHTLVEPWKRRKLPTILKEFPPEIVGLGPVATTLLAAISEPGSASVTDNSAVAQLIGRACSDRSLAELSWLASICDTWIATTGEPVKELIEVLAQRDSVGGRIEALRSDGIDVDEAEIMFLDHNITGAEDHLKFLETRRKAERLSQALSTSLENLKASAFREPTDPDWEDQFTAADRALKAGDTDEAGRIHKSLDKAIRLTRRSDYIAEIESIRRDLDTFRSPAALLAELKDHLAKLTENPDRSPDTTLLERSRERLETIRQQRSRDAHRRVDEARTLLDERDLISPDALPDLEVRLGAGEERLVAEEVMVALDLLDALCDDINAQRVHRWDASEGEQKLVQHVTNYCTQELHFEPDDVLRLYVAAKTKPFVILAGLTGSGKSTIARLFAGALGADDRNGRFQRVAVRPDWIDQSEVLGTVNPVSNRFEPGWLATTARQCERHPDQIHVVLLDEMNLAPVEQYLAEYLSALEEARSGSERTRVPLYSDGMVTENAVDWPSSLAFPLNLIVIGTVNIDETTRALSDRVLDRANVLQLSVAVSNAHHQPQPRSVQPWHVPFPEWESICERHPDAGYHDLLVEVGELLQGIGIGVGQRAHVELERFVANARGILTPERSLDLGLLQRIIPKIRGFKRDLADGLAELHEVLESADCSQSAAVVSLWLDDSVSDDEFLDGTDARIGLIR